MENNNRQSNPQFKILGIGGLIGTLAIGGLAYSSYQAEQEAIKVRIRDWEVRSYSVVEKKIEPRLTSEKYDCRMVFEPNISNQNYSQNFFGTITTQAKSTKTTTTKTKVSNPKPTTNTNKDSKTFDKIEPNQPNIKPNVRPVQPVQTLQCKERYYTVYDYWMRDSGDQKYTFATGLLSNNANPSGTNKNWKNWSVGDPIAKIKEYENYFLSGIDPIFSPMQVEKLSFDDFIPQEPKLSGEFQTQIDQVQFISPNNIFGYTLDQRNTINKALMKLNSELNNKENAKQINLQIFIIEENMDDYLRQICIKRLGCNKNDLILTIAIDKDKKITRIMGYSWSPSGFAIALELDNISYTQKLNLNTEADYAKFLETTKTLIKTKFERKEMKEFKYIREELERQVQAKRK